ncbi:hypothetical protein QJS10_CPB18g01253 [Acorus calamus]|uniref:Uncharacterized protein n=1 Tax=Acorus calamus TaxID=4465 RepID=A0AAV9CNN4_ACOCL|nr:hypothetical protein QJS10_CPB18g01253 [Acorus calamus]
MKGVKLSDCSICELIKGGDESLTVEDSRFYRMIDYFFPIQECMDSPVTGADSRYDEVVNSLARVPLTNPIVTQNYPTIHGLSSSNDL